MEICREMQKLRDLLDEKGIEWQDVSEDWCNDDFPCWICRTHFHIENSHISVINGRGSYGGFMLDPSKNAGLLEIMADRINHGEPVGSLKAREVIKLLEEKYEV